MTNAPIDSFRGEYRFLSNFWIEPDGTHVEGEYQAAKVDNVDGPTGREVARRVRQMKPGQAKRAGRGVLLRPDWEEVKTGIMRDLVHQKFQDHPDLAARLLATGDRVLIEGNTWGDTFWGVCNGQGLNHLGIILMAVREQLREHPQESVTDTSGDAAGDAAEIVERRLGARVDFERWADRLNDAWAVLRTVPITDGQAAIERHGIEYDEERGVGYFDGALADDLLEIAAYLRKLGERQARERRDQEDAQYTPDKGARGDHARYRADALCASDSA